MVRFDLNVELNYEIGEPGADFVFNVQAARTPQQVVLAENVWLSQPVPAHEYTDTATGNRLLRLRALPGILQLRYTALVDVAHHRCAPDQLHEAPVQRLPAQVLGYLYPSRYCQSDRFFKFAMGEFGTLPQGYARVRAIQDWVRQHVAFTSNSTNSTTSAVDTVIERVGVCRDFAHLMIALCRALGIPARFVSSTDYGADPALGPPDFHAYVEGYVGDRWYIFDPSGTAIPMGFLRLGTGRDAADVAIATIFGAVKAQAPTIRTRCVDDARQGLELPRRCDDALSTDAGPHDR
jgi:transglutaminase-like putative cysteine protease